MAYDIKALSAAAHAVAAEWTRDAPGGALLAFTATSPLVEATGGLESLASRRPFTGESLTRYASITKHVLCAMVLAHPEVIGLDDPLSRHLPELNACGRVTVREALGMIGGLPDTRESLALHGIAAAARTDRAALLAYTAQMEALNFAPGTETSYSNTGYRLVEEIFLRRGLRFADFVQAEVSAAIGHPMAVPELWDDPVPGLAEGYWPAPGGWRAGRQGMQMAAAGSLAGSARGLAAWVQSLMGPRADLLARLAAPQRLRDGRETRYGLGIMHQRIAGRDLMGHSGSQAGYKALFLIDKAADLGLVVVSNREDTNCTAIAQKLLHAAWGLPLPEVNCSPWAPSGRYVSLEGPRWIDLRPDGISHFGSEEIAKLDPHPSLVMESATTPVTLALAADGTLRGEIGYAAVKLHRVGPQEAAETAALEGEWLAPDQGSRFSIHGGRLLWGLAAQRQNLKLEPLGPGRWLFALPDEPWTAQVCLSRLGADQISLATARVRGVIYRRE